MAVARAALLMVELFVLILAAVIALGSLGALIVGAHLFAKRIESITDLAFIDRLRVMESMRANGIHSQKIQKSAKPSRPQGLSVGQGNRLMRPGDE